MFATAHVYDRIEPSGSMDQSYELSNTPKHVSASTYNPISSTDPTNKVAIAIDRAEGTRKACLAGLILSVLVGIGALVTGIISNGSHQTWPLSPAVKEFSILPVNMALLLITECLGYIHSTSLRWSLFYEGRLEFNSNLRLLTFSKHFGPNNAFFSITFFVCTALTYATANILLVFNTSSFYESQLQNGGSNQYQEQWEQVQDLVSLTKIVPIILAIAIFIMCALDFWCLKTTRIPSWSSDPLTTVAVGLNGGLVYRQGRAMMSVCDRGLPGLPKAPMTKQRSTWSISKTVPRIMLLNFAALVALIIWSAVITSVAYSNKAYQGQNGSSWSFIPTTTGAFAYINGLNGSNLQNAKSATITVFLFFFASSGQGNLTAVSEGRMLGVLLLYLAIQTVVTISMHCAELQVQLARDELVWRKIQSRNGSQMPSLYNSVLQPMEAWQGAGLLVFKVLIHWLFGAAIQVDYGQGMLMRPPQIVYMTIAWVGYVAFLVVVTFSKPKGCLPATYGHLQTMADLADEWTQKMYWGDKGLAYQHEGVRHCGTSTQPLPSVVHGELYA